MSDSSSLRTSEAGIAGSPAPDHVESASGGESIDRSYATARNEVHARTKVAILMNIPAPYRVQQFARLAASRRHEYLIYFCAETEPNRRWRPPQKYEFRHEILGARAHTFLGGYSYFVLGFLRKLIREKPGVVIVGGFSLQLLLARLYGWFGRIPVIVMSDTNILCERPLPAWRTILRRCMVHGIEGAIACSRLGVEYLHWLGVPPHRIAMSRCVNDALVFSEGVRAWRVARAEERRRFGVPADAVVALFVGRFEKHKGVVELLEAFATVHGNASDRLHLFLVGDGALEDTLRRIVTERSLTDCVTCAGFNSY